MIKPVNSVFVAIAWLCVYLMLVLAPLFVLLIGHVPSGSGFWWDFSMALGFTAMAMMGVQFLLTARFRHISAPFGIDIIYYFHRYLAIMAVSFILLHFLIIKFIYPETLGSANPLEAPFYMTSGRVALIIFSLMIISSLWRKQISIHYDEWRLLHIIFAVSGFLLAFTHINGVAYYIDVPEKRWLWGVYAFLWLTLIIYIRLIKPWLMFKRPYKVIKIKQERANSHTLVLQPNSGHEIVHFKPGQFAWLTLNSSPWHIKEHPFSISCSAVNNRQIEFTIKDLGDFTHIIKDIKMGDTAYIDGPYGIFSIDEYPQAKGYFFVTGGVGIAPVMSMLRSLADRHDKRPLVLICANDHWQDVIFQEDLNELKQCLNLNLLHVIKNTEEISSHNSQDNWICKKGLITEDIISALLPVDAENYEFFLCGPKPMSDSVQLILHKQNIPLGHIHLELFDMV